jgi:twinkle protein
MTVSSSGNATTAASAEAPAVLLPQHIEWLEQRRISAEVAKKFGLFSTVRSFEQDDGSWEKAQAIAIPTIERGKVVDHKYRRTSKKQHSRDKGAPLVLWNHDVLLERSDRPLVVTEGEWDGMIAAMLGWRVVSPPNGTPDSPADDVANAKRYEYLWRSQELLQQVKQFVIAVDDDKAGKALRQDLISLLGAERCLFVDSYGADCKDLSDVAMLYGLESAAQVLNNAKPVPIRGLYKLSDFPEPAPWPEYAIGVPGLSELINIVPSTLTVLTGWAGQGKTTLLLQIVASLLKQGISVTLGSFETMPRPILERKLRATLIGCNEHSIPVTQIAWADGLIERHLTLIAQMVGEDQEMSLEQVLEFARADVHRNGAKVQIIDPWNEIEHKRRKDETGTEYVGRCIRAVKHHMRAYNVAFWVVEHPAKPEAGNVKAVPGLYNASGSAHWANKADYGVSYSRPDKESNRAEVHVTKVRMGLPGREGKVELAYDWRISGFVDQRSGELAA